MRLPKLFRVFFSYPPAELALAVLAVLLLIKAQAVISFQSSRNLYAGLRIASRKTILSFLLKPFSTIRPTRLASLVEACDKNIGWKPSCLRRTFVLGSMLQGIGLRPDLRIGVHKEKDIFSAHAWLELDGMRLEMQNEGVSFTPLMPLPSVCS